MHVVMSPVASFVLLSVEHTLTEAFSKFYESVFIVGIIRDEPSNYRSNSSGGMLFPFVITIDDSTLGCGDVCCYLLGSGTFEKFLGIVLEEKMIARTTLILKWKTLIF